ncbi:LA2681 family HEPN domain-containing protein [Alkalihalobacterium alkalinitrilicum]|uniref:LA2681 family HEPN domain-containing protein n=1 Tax=Alkalihalobacterium alkalinitrilicum TaxID=427920 RepID=UPI000994BEA0|nr:LA2681 family HEPN domain-containing protein [Alkalihalobacterium alkalinitrilicum]
MMRSNRKSSGGDHSVPWTEENRWNNLCEIGEHLEEYNDYQLASFFKGLQSFLNEFPYQVKYYEKSLHLLKRVKNRFQKYSRLNYASIQLSLKEYKWKDPEIKKNNNLNRDQYYEILLESRKLLRYLESEEIRHDQEFHPVPKEEKKELPFITPQHVLKSVGVVYRATPNFEQEIQPEIIAVKMKLKTLYQYDSRIWDMIRIEKELFDYGVQSPDDYIYFNVELVKNFWNWIPFITLQADRTPYHIMLKWMAGIINSSKQVAEKYLVGSTHLSLEQEYGSILEDAKIGIATPEGLWFYSQAEAQLESVMYNSDGTHLFQVVIQAIKEEGLEELLTYTPPPAVTLEDIEEGPYPVDKEETYEQWCRRKELYLSLVPSFLSGNSKDDIHVSFLAGERNEYFAFLFELMKQEFVITRQFFFETLKGYETSTNNKKKFYIERTKQCYLQSYGLFDRVATFIKEYFDLTLPKKVTYHGIWHENDDPKYENTRKSFRESMNYNPFLQTLYSLSRDIFYEKEKSHLAEEYSDLAKIRNLIAHSFIYIKVENDGSSEPHNKIETITIEDLLKKTEALLTRVRDVLVYLVLFLLAEEKVKALE